VVISFGLFICLSKEWLVLRINVLLVVGELREKFKLANVRMLMGTNKWLFVYMLRLLLKQTTACKRLVKEKSYLPFMGPTVKYV